MAQVAWHIGARIMGFSVLLANIGAAHAFLVGTGSPEEDCYARLRQQIEYALNRPGF